MAESPDPGLPLSSLRLLVPPLRLMSACMWKVAQERNVDQYEKLAEFITLVTDMVPELLDYRQRTQLILGLRARLILELLEKMNEADCETLHYHLDSFLRTSNQVHEEDQAGEVEISKSAFVKLVKTLLRDKSKKEHFFKEVFPVQYGARFDTALQILVWEFFYRLEDFLPVPSFSQVFDVFELSTLDYEFDPFVSEDLKRVIQHRQERHKLRKSKFTFRSDTILSTLASAQTSAASEDSINQKIHLGGGESEQKPERSLGGNQEKSELNTLQQEDSCSVGDLCEDDEVIDSSSVEDNATSRPQEFGLSPLSSSPCSEDADAAGDSETAGEAAFQPSRCSEVKEHLVVNGDKREKRTIWSSTGDRAGEPTCLQCGKTFASISTLKSHRLVHSSARPFKCTQCNKMFKRRRDLNQHLLTHSPQVLSFACNLCEKKFRTRYLLKCHLRHHTGERPFACSYCDKRFRTSATMKCHERIHTGERPYACTLCDKKFTQLYMRTVHLRVHRKEKPYLCSTCGMAFCSSGALLVHSRVHTGERPHTCEFCKKGFTMASHLTRHRRFHTGERPYSCSHCDKSFHSSPALKNHIRTHTGEKPYECLTCHKRFSLRSNMKVHLKVHKKI